MARTVLIVDDDPVQRRLLTNMVSRFGYEAVAVDNGDAAIAMLKDPNAARVDCMVLDLVMPDLDGLGVLAKLRELELSVPVIVQTAHGGIDNVVSAMRAGAVDFAVKPVGAERLHVSLRNALATRALEGELGRIKRSRSGTLTFRDIITRNPAMQVVLRQAEKAAVSMIPVHVDGESGVGKELVARAIHGCGERRGKPFIAVNCGAIPESLVESILFGHEKGAFTGATERHVGKFVEAAGGTLFLDEIGELPAAAQVKLLRAIQEGEVEPLGARKPLKVDVRLISATNRDLIADVKSGRFREDLFYRLHVFPVSIPPLRARPQDIPDLVRHFLARFAAEEGKRISAITTTAMARLAAYHWPGNVRQLENTIFRAVVLAEQDTIDCAELPQISPAPETPEAASAAVRFSREKSDAAMPPQTRADAGNIIPLAEPAALLSLLDVNGEIRTLADIESFVIDFAISHYGGRMSEVARRLQIGRSTLYRKLESTGLGDATPTPQSGGGPDSVAAK